MAAVVFACVMIPDILNNGGMRIYHSTNSAHHHHAGDPSTWLPLKVALPAGIGFLSIFFFAGTAILLSAANCRIETDDEGIVQIGWLGKEQLRVRWQDIITVSVDADAEWPSTKLIAPNGTFEISHSRRDAGEILRTVRERSGHASPNPDAAAASLRAASATGEVMAADRLDPRFLPDPRPVPAGSSPSAAAPAPAASRAVRDLRTFRYKFPWSAGASCLPFLPFAWMVLSRPVDLSIMWPILLIVIGLPVLIVGSALIRYRNRKVILEPNRLIVVDWLGREVFNALWDGVDGVFSDSMSGDRSDMDRCRIYRVEAGDAKAYIGSNLKGFNECLREIHLRLPPSAIVAG